MRSEDFWQMWDGIDEKYIDRAGKDLEKYRNRQRDNKKAHRKSVWKNTLAAATYTAAAIFGVFAVIIGVGKIRLESSSDSSGVSLNANSSGLVSPVNDEYQLDLNENFSGEISVNAAYGYEDNSTKIKRYEIGDKFGENAEITSAKSTFSVIDGKPFPIKQELTVKVNYLIEYSTAITENCLKELNLPSFGSGFKINPLFSKRTNTNDNNSDNDYLMQITTINIIVDYSDKTITPFTHGTDIRE